MKNFPIICHTLNSCFPVCSKGNIPVLPRKTSKFSLLGLLCGPDSSLHWKGIDLVLVYSIALVKRKQKGRNLGRVAGKETHELKKNYWGGIRNAKNKLEIRDLKEAGEAERQSFIEGGGEIVCCVRQELAEREENN